MKILAIESSCDETTVAIVENGRKVITNQIYTQITIHKKFGGVVPEIASRNHVEKLPFVLDNALKDASMTLNDIDAFAVTQGPGLIGALLVGVSAAKAISYASGKPLIPVHHIEGHIAANYLDHPGLEPPFLCLVVSGGHTNLIHVKDYTQFDILGSTYDDAAGEAYDKVARVLGFPYPGGPQIDAAAKTGDPDAFDFPRALSDKDNDDFSFSGLKSAVLNTINAKKMKGEIYRKEDIAASFQNAVIDVLVDKTMNCAKRLGVNKIAMAGGVSANKGLRLAMGEAADGLGAKLYYPSPVLCTDNAAMIGSMAYYNYQIGKIAKLDLAADPSLAIGES